MVEQISKKLHITPQTMRKAAASMVGIVAVTLAIVMITIAKSASEACDVDTATSTAISGSELSNSESAVVGPKKTIPDQEHLAWAPNPTEAEALAKTLYGECRGVKSQMEQAAVAWCVLNRVDSKYYPNTVLEVLTQPSQFQGYGEEHPILPSLKAIAEDVLTRWHLEKEGKEDVGRVLPKTYIYFVGDGVHNYFTEEFLGKVYWDFSLDNPYAN